jgi:hypothetical protein
MKSSIYPQEKLAIHTGTFPNLYIHHEDINRNDPLIAIIVLSQVQGVVVTTNMDGGWPVGELIDIDPNEWVIYDGSILVSN